jgi:hypothetical protein
VYGCKILFSWQLSKEQHVAESASFPRVSIVVLLQTEANSKPTWFTKSEKPESRSIRSHVAESYVSRLACLSMFSRKFGSAFQATNKKPSIIMPDRDITHPHTHPHTHTHTHTQCPVLTRDAWQAAPSGISSYRSVRRTQKQGLRNVGSTSDCQGNCPFLVITQISQALQDRISAIVGEENIILAKVGILCSNPRRTALDVCELHAKEKRHLTHGTICMPVTCKWKKTSNAYF